jgi:hypothetical protein
MAKWPHTALYKYTEKYMNTVCIYRLVYHPRVYLA